MKEKVSWRHQRLNLGPWESEYFKKKMIKRISGFGSSILYTKDWELKLSLIMFYHILFHNSQHSKGKHVFLRLAHTLLRREEGESNNKAFHSL